MRFQNNYEKIDYGPNPFVTNVGKMAARNDNFRTTIWTGIQMQMTLMSINPYGEIGLEIHPDTDQIIRVEQGNALVKMGKCKTQRDVMKRIGCGEVVFVPAGTWHNIVNECGRPLKVSTIYAPPHHAAGTVHRTKKDAEMEDY